MHIQPITTNQPSYKGKVIFEKDIMQGFATLPTEYVNKTIQGATELVKDKKYNIYVSKNAQNPEFYYVAANKNIEQAKKIKEYTVKIQSGIALDSLITAVKDAMEMYEKYISKSIKG